ncbi:PIN domain-containing protein [Candidatus Contendibacter odensensis]|uniref:PilT protein-like protein n=1 Tax=Candidatus Contendobacter odensis Run_B_J11 TaxID=1400861 RepID=A0A7U7J2Z5_9GAMM|nr:PIN domain-containing protein [Candidatus Contendobacter odensis]CDH44007.1 putative PilT protein-like protein [Candidatus Contendobacter odensis Run_B_J11]
MLTVCVDTNLWFYALARPAASDLGKHLAAQKLIFDLNQPLITPQIINEVSANLLRKQKWSEQQLRQLIGELQVRCQLFRPEEDWCEQASILRERYGFSFWDSLIVASAQAADCDTLFSEDMQHGLRINSLEIINPFAGLLLETL